MWQGLISGVSPRLCLVQAYIQLLPLSLLHSCLLYSCPSSAGRMKPKKHHQQQSQHEPCLYSNETVVPKSAESQHEKQRLPHQYYKRDKYKHVRDGGIETAYRSHGSHRSHKSHRSRGPYGSHWRTPVGPQYLGELPEERSERVQSVSFEQDCSRYCVMSHSSEQLHACTSRARVSLPRGHWSHSYNPRPQFPYSEHGMHLDSEHRDVYECSHPRVSRHHFDAWTGTDWSYKITPVFILQLTQAAKYITTCCVNSLPILHCSSSD